jgi:hypothetical protein
MNLGTLKLSKINIIFFISMVFLFTACTKKINIDYSKKIETLSEDTNNTNSEVSIFDKNKENIVLKKDIQKQIVPKKNEIIVKKQKVIPLDIKELETIPQESIIEESAISTRQSTELNTNNLDQFKFDFIKKGKQDKNTLLIVGGIQGDEPGGFMAASLFSTHYNVIKGSVWVIPNLNFYSIIKRSRGPYGDMNRKFSNLSKDDPEYEIITRIKNYIKSPEVSLILNLHDGSGYYRPKYIDSKHQPRKWGQCLVIDQENLDGVNRYANTFEISEEVVKHLNENLLDEEHIYRTKNTHTRFQKTYEETEMAKTLTYYAVKQGKSAFGHETSKDLTVEQRVYYKLLAIEKYMDIMGIKYQRNFPLTVEGIKKALNDDINVKFDDIDINMPLKDIRNIQKYFPINKSGVIKYLPSNPLIKIIKVKNEYIIYYGNRRLTKLQADYKEHINFDTKIDFIIDGKNKKVKFGDTIKVKKTFIVKQHPKFRINVIGYKSKSGIETDQEISKDKFLKQYSIEKNGNIYRIEFYKENKFVGMILVEFI